MNYYKVLGLPMTASEADIKKAYRGLAKKYHPDVSSGNEVKFAEITKAYDCLLSLVSKPNSGGLKTFCGTCKSTEIDPNFSFTKCFECHKKESDAELLDGLSELYYIFLDNTYLRVPYLGVTKDGKIQNIKNGRVYKPSVVPSGGLNASISVNGCKQSFLIHRLVACVYLPRPDGCNRVTVKDGNPQNTHVDNLIWTK